MDANTFNAIDGSAMYRRGATGATLADVRRWIATHPLTDDDYGKGFVTPLGHRIAWATEPMFGQTDGWPAHVDGIEALGYLTDDYDEWWRGELKTFRAEPGITREWIEDYDTYGSSTSTYGSSTSTSESW